MQALIRGEEILIEPFNVWITEHITWMTAPRPDGDGYTLIDDYQPEEESSE